MKLRRSALTIPGNSIKMITKGADSLADAVVLDLEDSVPPSEKEKARSQVKEALKSFDFKDKERAVRINSLSTPFAYRDIIEAIEAAADAIVIPKVESSQDIIFVDQILAQVEKDIGTDRVTTIQALIESARGIQAVDEISRASSRLTALIFGHGDYFSDIGVKPPDDAERLSLLLLYPKSRIIIAATTAGIDAIDNVFPNFKDTEGLRTDAQRGSQMGFKGKWVIHPTQIEIVNEVFTPTLEEFKKAKAMVEAYERAKAEGKGAIVLEDRMVDEASVVLARKQCEMAKQLGLWDKLSEV